MAANACTCAHCGKKGVSFKRCSVCKDVSYCGAACQKAAWKGHKKTCRLPLKEVCLELEAAIDAEDAQGVLKWEGRIDEMMEKLSHYQCENILSLFVDAHKKALNTVGGEKHVVSMKRLIELRGEVFGKMERFRDQGGAICDLAEIVMRLEGVQAAGKYFQRARDLGEAHGFFSVESRACEGLAHVAMEEGRNEAGVELLRNALAAAGLNEDDAGKYELSCVQPLNQGAFRDQRTRRVGATHSAISRGEQEGVATRWAALLRGVAMLRR